MKGVKRGKLKEVYKGIVFSIKQQDIFFPDGSKKIYEYCERPSSVTVLAFDKNNKLLLIKERRAGSQKPVWFLPAGKVEKNDSPKQAALRELQEEAGFTAKKIKLIHKKTPSNTMLWDIYIYAAKDLRVASLKGDEYFPIEVIPTSLNKAVKMALDGTIKNEFISYNIIRFHYMLKHGQFKW